MGYVNVCGLCYVVALLATCSLVRLGSNILFESLALQANAPITVMPYYPRVVVGGDLKGISPQQHALWEEHLPCMEDFYCTFAYLCIPD